MPTSGWFDSHCHFDFPAFDSDRDRVWLRSVHAGVSGLLIPGVDRQQCTRLPELVDSRPWSYAIGLHPFFMHRHTPDDLEWLNDQSTREQGASVSDFAPPVAIGEIGLHMTRQVTREERLAQYSLFEQQLVIAREANLPVILHGVGAHDDIVAAMRRLRYTSGGVIHGFSGSLQQARAYMDLGVRIGIGGAFFHARAQRLRRTLVALPLDGILLETDAPDMTPPFLGESRNTPEIIPLIAVGVSRLKNTPMAVLKNQLVDNLLAGFPRVAFPH